jgi:hypothetical protein
MTDTTKLFDRRGREWESFLDRGYYDMHCVRLASDRSFNAPMSFHFTTLREAERFVELVKVSS